MHHYTISGMPNVWLANGYEERKTVYGPAIAFAEIDHLWRVLCLHLVRKPGRLTGKEFRYLRSNLHLAQSEVALRQGVSEQAVSLWERHGKVPKANDALMRLYYLAEKDDNVTLKEAIGRINVVERTVHQKIVATLKRSKWTLEVQVDERASTNRSTGKDPSKTVKPTKVVSPNSATKGGKPSTATKDTRSTNPLIARMEAEADEAARQRRRSKPDVAVVSSRPSRTAPKVVGKASAKPSSKTAKATAVPRAIEPVEAASPARPVKPGAVTKRGGAVEPVVSRRSKVTSRAPAYG